LGRRRLSCIAVLVLTGFLAGCGPSSQFADFSPAAATSSTQVADAQDAVDAAALDDSAQDDGTQDDDAVDRPDVDILAYAAPAHPTADRARIDQLITKYAMLYNVPVSLVHRVVKRESTYNSKARNGIHRGLMQLNPTTARTMGFRGSNSDLHDADTNLRYGVKYLAGAWLVSKFDPDLADKLYQTGYYYRAKQMGLLKETGLRK